MYNILPYQEILSKWIKWFIWSDKLIFFWIYHNTKLLLWLMKVEKYNSIQYQWLHTQKNEHIPKKIKLYDQIIHFIHSDKTFYPLRENGLSW